MILVSFEGEDILKKEMSCWEIPESNILIDIQMHSNLYTVSTVSSNFACHILQKIEIIFLHSYVVFT